MIGPDEQLFGLTEMTKIMPSINGKRCGFNTLWRWCRKGIKGVRLEYIRVGRQIATSRESMARFYADLAAADVPEENRPLIHHKPQRVAQAARRRSLEEADRILKEAGL